MEKEGKLFQILLPFCFYSNGCTLHLISGDVAAARALLNFYIVFITIVTEYKTDVYSKNFLVCEFGIERKIIFNGIYVCV